MTRTVVDIKLSLGVNSPIIRDTAIIDTGCSVKTIPIGSLLDYNVDSATLNKMIDYLLDKYKDKIILSNTASGAKISSIPLILSNVIIGEEKFKPFYIHLSLVKNIRFILLGWDFITSHSNMFHNESYGKLVGFNRKLYDSLEIHKNSIDGDIFFNNLLNIIN